MAIITDNIRIGAVRGIANEMTGSSAGPTLTYVVATPDEILTGQTGSDLALDVKGGNLYMCEAKGGSEWIRLNSGT